MDTRIVKIDVKKKGRDRIVGSFGIGGAGSCTIHHREKMVIRNRVSVKCWPEAPVSGGSA